MMGSDWKHLRSNTNFDYAIHDYYKVITLTQSDQSPCKFGCSRVSLQAFRAANGLRPGTGLFLVFDTAKRGK